MQADSRPPPARADSWEQALLELALWLDEPRATRARLRLEQASPSSVSALAVAVLASVAYPASAPFAETHGHLLADCDAAALRETRTRSDFVERLRRAWPLGTPQDAGASLRLFARQQKLRIALRELLPPSLGGAPFEQTARELSGLAEALVEAALEVALRSALERYREPRRGDGAPSRFAVLGMGKLAGYELNAGSDLDLVYVYDADDGCAPDRAGSGELSLHAFWDKVARQLTALLDESTAEGAVWRVDLRLRPEGRNGPLVNSMPAMLRYYETWGRLWERAVLLRARPVAGDLALGRSLLAELRPFVVRRRVEPALASDLIHMLERARLESTADPSRDLKLGAGGIRELEMFVQALQLVWAGVEPGIEAAGTLEGLRRLLGRGLVTDLEATDLAEAYVLLRRAEHVVQNATGVRTHALPVEPNDRRLLARCMGFGAAGDLEAKLGEGMRRVHAAFLALAPGQPARSRWDRLVAALDQGARELAEAELGARLARPAPGELAGELLRLAERPDSLFGSLTRESHPEHAPALLDALVESADPEQAARHLRAFLSRLPNPATYVSLLASNPRAARRFVTLLGASAFVSEAVACHAELGDHVLFSRGMPSAQRARAEPERETEALPPHAREDPEALVGALRRAKMRVTLEVALADIAGEVGVREPGEVLAALADACVERALRIAAAPRCDTPGFAVLALGSLGARELGYGSDLDLLFVFDPSASAGDQGALARHARFAQRTMALLSVLHEDGPGYSLDTRLRPSGSQGVLVTSLPAFARYHGVLEDGSGPAVTLGTAAPWERQTLVGARACAGDLELGERVMRIAHVAAFELGEPDPAETHRIRTRLEREVGRERGGRSDVKVGRGGILEAQLAVRTLQMRHGRDARVRVAGTHEAIEALAACGYLGGQEAAALRDSYLFLRQLERRMQVVHASSMSLLEAGAPGLPALARRMGLRDAPRATAAEQLVGRYRAVSAEVRAAYLRVLGARE